MAGFEAAPVMDEALLMVATPEREAALGGARTFAALSRARFVDYQTSAPAVRGWFRHHFGRVPARLELVLVVDSVQAVIKAIRHGMGMGVVPSHTVAAELEAGTLVAVGTRKRAIVNRVSLVRVLDKVPSRAEKAFVRFLERWPAKP